MNGEGVWREVTDALLAGVAHDLSDRISALAGIAHILALDHAEEPLVEMLGSEVIRLEQTVQLLRAYPRGEGGERRALALADVIPPLAGLYERRAAEEGIVVEVEEARGLPAVRADWVGLARAVLVLLWATGRAAALTAERRVAVALRAEGDEVVVELSAPGAETGGLEAATTAAAGLAARAGGRVERAESGWRVRLPAA